MKHLQWRNHITRLIYLKHSLILCMVSLVAIGLAGCGVLVTTAPPIQATGSTAVVKPYPSATSTQAVYKNPLTSQTARWANAPECMFTGNGLSVRPGGGQAYICLAPTSPLSDVSVTVTVQQISGSPIHAYGIAFRHTAPKNYNFFGIDGHGHFIFTAVVNDISHTIIPFTASPAIHTELHAANQLQVIAKGAVVTLFVNGKAVGQATLSGFPAGTVGLRGINDGEVVFTQLSIAQV